MFLGLLGSVALCPPRANADSAVVFNEIMYHPAEAEPSMEWLELHNAMSVNLDLSNWSIDGGIEFRFPEGTVIPGGGYLVVSINPAALKAATGATNIIGPFTGRLGNSGEKLELRNNNLRRMDEVFYGTSGGWPVAADGAGVSLAKRSIQQASGTANNWVASAQIGGTPGTLNFPTSVAPSNLVLVAWEQRWRFDNSGLEPDSAWVGLDGDDHLWRVAPAPLLWRRPAGTRRRNRIHPNPVQHRHRNGWARPAPRHRGPALSRGGVRREDHPATSRPRQRDRRASRLAGE